MDLLLGFLIVLEIIVSVLLILVVLVQPSKSGGGLGGAIGGGMGEQLFGARTGNVLTRATIVLATVFLVNTLGLAFLYSRQDQVFIPAPTGPGLEAPEGVELPAEPVTLPEVPAEETAAEASAEAEAAPAE